VSALPGGTGLEVGIAAPLSGAVLPADAVAVSGMARVGVAAPLPTDLVLVLDVSGSTSLGGACGGDQNGDGVRDTVLDCELAALRAINEQVVAAASVDHVSLVLFANTGITADVSPQPGDQVRTPPGADLDLDGGTDLGQVLSSVRLLGNVGTVVRFTTRQVTGSATSFGAALQSVAGVLASSTASRKLVVLVSDGFHNVAPGVAATLPLLPAQTRVLTVAAGPGSACGAGVDSLQHIADATGGTCTHISNLVQLPNLAPGLVRASLTAVTLSVDGAALPAPSLTPALPVDGPATVSWSTSVPGLAPGPHLLCASAAGKDVGGAGSVEDCVTVRINSPPTAVCVAATVAADALCQGAASVAGQSSDPDGNLASCGAMPPGPYGLGDTTVTLTCTDTLGATASCTAPVKVLDLTPPVFSSVPPARCTHHRHVTLGTATATDACGLATVSNDAPLHFPCGLTVVTWTATDGAGNQATATQQVWRRCEDEDEHARDDRRELRDGGAPRCHDDDDDDACEHRHPDR
jgi:hypothetical protein